MMTCFVFWVINPHLNTNKTNLMLYLDNSINGSDGLL